MRWTERLILLVVCCSGASLLLGQQNLDDFFRQRLRERRINQTSDRPAADPTDRPAWIEQVTVRTKTDEYDFNRQEYVLRLSPTTPRIRRAQLKSRELLLDRANWAADELRMDWIDRTYEETLDLYAATREAELQRDLLLVLRDQERVWQRLLATTQNPKDWIEAQEAILAAETDLQRNVARRAELLPNGTEVAVDSLVSLARIRTFVTNHLTNASASSYLQNQQNLDRALLDAEVELERAEGRRIFDFLEAEYRGPHSDPFRQRLNLTASFELSRSGSRWLKLQELAVERDLLNREQRTELELHADERRRRAQELLRRIDIWEDARRRSSAQAARADQLVKRASGREGVNPLLQLYQRERTIRQEMDFLELELKIYEEYLAYLAHTMLLYEVPVRNYLRRM